MARWVSSSSGEDGEVVTGVLPRDALGYLSGMPQSGSSLLAHSDFFARRRSRLGLAAGLCLAVF